MIFFISLDIKCQEDKFLDPQLYIILCYKLYWYFMLCCEERCHIWITQTVHNILVYSEYAI